VHACTDWSDRCVRLALGCCGVPQLLPGAGIDLSGTAPPLELDKLYTPVRTFANDLGPEGVNARGALSDVISVGAANLGGNGKLLNTTIADLGKLSQTLADSSGDLYATVANLNKFSEMLKNNDAQIRLVENQFAEVSGFLSADREELGAALESLARALGEVKQFIAENRKELTDNVDRLTRITKILVEQRA